MTTVQAVRLNGLERQFRDLRDLAARMIGEVAALRADSPAGECLATMVTGADGIELIAGLVATQYQVERRALSGKSRAQSIVWPRQVAMWLCRELLDCTLAGVGAAFGGRDHGTVRNAVTVCRYRMETSPRHKQELEALRARAAQALQA